MADVQTANFSFTCNTVLGNQTIVSGLPFTAKGYILYCTYNTVSGSFNADAGFMIGLCDGTRQFSCGWRAQDGSNTSNTGRAYSDAAVIQIPTAATPDIVDGVATHVSMGTSIVINWTNVVPSAYLVYGIAFGGADITPEVRTYTAGRTGVGTQSYVTTINPNAGLFVSVGSTAAPPDDQIHYSMGIGWAVSNTKFHVCCMASEDGLADTDSWSYANNDGCLMCLEEDSGAVRYKADLVSWNTGGFTLEYLTATGLSTTDVFAVMVFQGGNWDLGNVAKRTTTGTTQVNTDTTVDTIKHIFIQSTCQNLGASVLTHNRFSFGAGSSITSENGLWYGDSDATTAQVTAQREQTGNILITATEATNHNSSVVTGLADLSVVGDDTFTLNYTTATAVAATIFWVTLGTTSVQNLTRTLTDTYDVTDSVARLKSAPRTLTDTYNVTDSVGVSVSKTRGLSESYNVTDVVSRAQILTRAIQDTYNVSDVVTRSQILIRLITESYNVTDTVNRMFNFLRNLSDTYNLTDAVNKFSNFTRLITETYNVADAVVRSQQLTRTLTDSYNVTEVVTILQHLMKTVSDSYNVTDTESHSQILIRQISDTYNVVDSLNKIITYNKTLTESFNVVDIVTRFQQLIREIADTYSITDTVVREQVLTRVLTDTYNVTDSITTASVVIVSLEETYNVTDTIIRSLIITRALSDTYNVNDSIDRLLQFTRLLSDTYDVNETIIRSLVLSRLNNNESYNVSDIVEYQKESQGLSVQLNESYNVTDTVIINQILQRILTEDTYDVTDTVTKVGGEPIIIDERDRLTGGGGGHISQPMFNKLKRRMMIKTLNDFLPKGFPDKIIIDNQKAFFLDNKIPQNRISAQTVIKPTKNNRFLNNVYSWKEKQIDLQIENTMRELKKNKIDTQTYIRSLPKKVLITNYDNVNNVLLNHNLNQISASVIIEEKGHLNSLYSPIIIETNIQPNSITNGIKILNSSDKSNNNILSNSVYINYKDNNTLNNSIIVKPRSASIIKGNITEYKKDKVKKIKDFMLNRTKYTTYENLLKDIIFKNKDQDKKENLMYYISTYQTRFDIERTNTNKDMVKLEKAYQSKIKNLYKKIFDEYKTQPHRMSEMREKYHKPVYDLIRSISDKGYDLGIDYVSKATGRPDIYLTETDIENVKYQSDKSTIHFFESIEKQIKKEVIKESAESLTESYVPPTDMTIEGATSLLIGSLSTGLVALATISKLQQIQDLFIDQNVPIKFVFITERDIRVCPYCSTLDYRISNYEFTLNNINMMPKPPIHLNCRCRILLKIGQRIIVK